jgi:rRNA maturation endonuclease Nob1
MASSPDLFVVCKNCGSEVSPYITECPYCGTRLRKRAPKIERDGTV